MMLTEGIIKSLVEEYARYNAGSNRKSKEVRRLGEVDSGTARGVGYKISSKKV
jgi:hypothetical protein